MQRRINNHGINTYNKYSYLELQIKDNNQQKIFVFIFFIPQKKRIFSRTIINQ